MQIVSTLQKAGKYFSRLLGVAAVGLLLLQASIVPVHAQERAWGGVCVSQSDPDVATLQGLECLLGNVLSVFFALIGLAAFVMIVIGSVKILISGGNSKEVDSGKKTITLAIIGIVVALAGFILVNLLSSFTGVNLLEFEIPRSTEPAQSP